MEDEESHQNLNRDNPNDNIKVRIDPYDCDDDIEPYPIYGRTLPRVRISLFYIKV